MGQTSFATIPNCPAPGRSRHVLSDAASPGEWARSRGLLDASGFLRDDENLWSRRITIANATTHKKDCNYEVSVEVAPKK